MISYEVKINGKTIKRIDARRMRGRNEEMDKTGYEYVVTVWDYENEDFVKGKVSHKYQDGFGKLLEIITKDLKI